MKTSAVSPVRRCECGCGETVLGPRARFARGHYLGNGRVPREEFHAKLCECGCGQPVPIAKETRRGYRKGQPMRFVRGHFSRTADATPPPIRSGSDNNKWKGDAVEYDDLHRYLARHFPKAGICEECGRGASTDYALIHGRSYTRERCDYRELCRLCHNRYDEPWTHLRHDAQGRWIKCG
jgi:hypothetical protein